MQIWTSVSIYDSWVNLDGSSELLLRCTVEVDLQRYLPIPQPQPRTCLGTGWLMGRCFDYPAKVQSFFLALLSHILTLAFIQLVERPHMQKLYGRSLRKDAGLVKNLKRSLPPPLQQLGGSVDRMVDESL